MQIGEATFALTGGSVKSTRRVPPHEKRAMQELHRAAWAGFDSNYATKYDKAEERPRAAEAPVLLLPLAAAAGKEEAVARRPVFMLLASAMTGVKFGSDADEKDWNMYDFDEDFERGGEVELANVVGAFLHTRTLRSDVLDRFYLATQQTSDALFDSFQYLAGMSISPAVNATISAIYCYWRFESELLHPDFQRQLSLWRGDEIRGGLLEIISKWKQGADETSQKEALADIFEKMGREIRERLQECPDSIRRIVIKTGSFANFVWAPRVWVFFVMLRLRHDEDFSRALWNKGFRLVAADLHHKGIFRV